MGGFPRAWAGQQILTRIFSSSPNTMSFPTLATNSSEENLLGYIRMEPHPLCYRAKNLISWPTVRWNSPLFGPANLCIRISPQTPVSFFSMKDHQRILSFRIPLAEYETGVVDITEKLYEIVPKEEIEIIKQVIATSSEEAMLYTVVIIQKEKKNPAGSMGFKS
jgi:hypothetical protein